MSAAPRPTPPLPYPRLLLYAALVGLVGGLLATLFYLALKLGFQVLWNELPGRAILPPWDQLRYRVWLITGLGGLLVGLVVKHMGAAKGLNEAVAEIHEQGKLDYRYLPGTALAAWISITVGSSAGPESPLIDLNGGLASWLAQRLGLGSKDLRTLTFCGMGAGMGVFFSAPLGAALFVLELPHQRSLEFFEAIIPTLLSSVIGFITFRSITGISIGGIYNFPPYAELRLVDIGAAILLGAIGAAVGLLFLGINTLVKRLTQPLQARPILLATLGGLAFGVIALFYPITLFYGEEQIRYVIDQGTRYSPIDLFTVALMNLITLSLSLQAGFKGGVVFPLFFVGACVGMGVHQIWPGMPLAVALVCAMAGVTIAVIKAPMGIIMMLNVISHTSITPLITTAGMVSFLISLPFNFVPNQQPRQDLTMMEPPQELNPRWKRQQE